VHTNLAVIEVKQFERPPVVVPVYYILVRNSTGVHLIIHHPELNHAGNGVQIYLEGNNQQINLALIVEQLNEGRSIVFNGR